MRRESNISIIFDDSQKFFEFWRNLRFLKSETFFYLYFAFLQNLGSLKFRIVKIFLESLRNLKF